MSPFKSPIAFLTLSSLSRTRQSKHSVLRTFFAFSLVHGAPETPGSESLPEEGAKAEARRGTARREADLGGAVHCRRASGAPLRRWRTGEHPRVDFHVERSGSIRGQTRYSRARRSREEW